MNNFVFFDNNIGEIHKKFKSGSLTPLFLAESLNELFDKLQLKFYPWVSFDRLALLKKAGDASQKIKTIENYRYLEGIPIAVKDIINTYDFPTQMGSPLWKNFTPGNDARVVYNLKHNGAIVAGKSVTAEFAVHTLNETLNPHDISRTPGTSSSGSAVAVALGMTPVAIGTQTAGSIVRPASFCGIYGCKPSFGLIPRTGLLKTTDSLDSVGFFSLHYSDIRRIFESIRVHGPNYPFSYKAFNEKERLNKPSGRPWKIAFCKTHTWAAAENYAQQSMVEFIKKISRHNEIEIVELELPSEFENCHNIHSAIYNKTLSYYFSEEYKKSEFVSQIMNELIRAGNEIPTSEFVKALDDQIHLSQLMDDLLKEFDVILSLSTAGEAPLRSFFEKPDPALMWTMTHLPVISIPQFVSPSGLPFGFQALSRRFNDYKLFRFTDFLHNCGLIPKSSNPCIRDIN